MSGALHIGPGRLAECRPRRGIGLDVRARTVENEAVANPNAPMRPAAMSFFHRAAFSTALAGMLIGMAPVNAQLADEKRTNGIETLKAVEDIQRHAAASTVQIGKSKEKSVSSVVLSPDGYVLTQASDAEPLRPLRAFLPDGKESEAREVKRDDRLNLLLLKLERTGMESVSWGESLSLRTGQWLCSLTKKGKDIRLGVVSAKRRNIPNSGAVLGVRFGVDDEEDGVIVEELAIDSPAHKAGLRNDDVILAVDDKKVRKNEDVKNIIMSHRPGDLVKIRYAREGTIGECEVNLASRRHVQMNWDGEDFANHGTSLRTDNFPEVIQHDLPLNPADMGGAVFDLQGRAIAVNIARVDRVTNYALPVETFLPEVMKWMKEDRERPKGQVQSPVPQVADTKSQAPSPKPQAQSPTSPVPSPRSKDDGPTPQEQTQKAQEAPKSKEQAPKSQDQAPKPSEPAPKPKPKPPVRGA
jgi:serine protease Do